MLTVADIFGRVISSETILQNNTEFDFNGFPNAIYIITLKLNNGELYSQKVVKEE